MKIKCISIKTDFGTPEDDSNSGIKINETYDVYGVLVMENSIKYLIFDRFNRANPYLAENFKVIDPSIPDTYYCAYRNRNDGIILIMGYKALVMDPDHYVGLVELEAKDVKLFHKYKSMFDLEILIKELNIKTVKTEKIKTLEQKFISILKYLDLSTKYIEDLSFMTDSKLRSEALLNEVEELYEKTLKEFE